MGRAYFALGQFAFLLVKDWDVYGNWAEFKLFKLGRENRDRNQFPSEIAAVLLRNPKEAEPLYCQLQEDTRKRQGRYYLPFKDSACCLLPHPPHATPAHDTGDKTSGFLLVDLTDCAFTMPSLNV